MSRRAALAAASGLAGLPTLPASAAGLKERLTITKIELFPSDILSFQRVHNLLSKPFEIKDSCITVPQGPGLGVELDEDALLRYRFQD